MEDFEQRRGSKTFVVRFVFDIVLRAAALSRCRLLRLLETLRLPPLYDVEVLFID